MALIVSVAPTVTFPLYSRLRGDRAQLADSLARSVQVTTLGGISPTSPADQFTYTITPAPTVTSLNPTSGTTAGGKVDVK